MEEVIKKIIKIEEEAAQIEKDMDEKIKQKKLEQDKKLEKLHQVLKQKAISKVETLREREMNEIEEDVNNQRMMMQKHADRLDHIANKKMDQWVEMVFTEIIKE